MEIKIRKTYYTYNQEPTNKLFNELSTLNGVEHGLQKYYHFNGQLDWKYYMKNDKCNGLSQKWNDDGSLYIIRQNKDHEGHGPEIFFRHKTV